jgi:hypothetical protein
MTDRGRTLFDILTGRNQRDMRPLELQYHNPLEAKVGCTVAFEHEPEISGINFVIEKISVYKTTVGSKDFFHTDYHLKGISVDHDSTVRLRLRLISDEKSENGQRIQLLYLYDQFEFDKDFHDNNLGDPTGELHVTQDDEGNDLDEPRKYWRVEDVLDPYKSRLTILRDIDGNGTIEDEELEHKDVTYWDYSRNTDDSAGNEITEYLTVEMDTKTGYFDFLRGTDVLSSQISVF